MTTTQLTPTNFPNRANPAKRLNRARRALVWSLLAFFGFQFSLTVFIETVQPGLRDKRAQQKQDILRVQNSQSRPDALRVVMVGSSRVLSGFDANRLDGLTVESTQQPVTAFNYGLSGGGPLRSLVTVHRLLESDAKPDLLILEIMPPWMTEGQYEIQPTRFWADEFGSRDMAVVSRYAESQQSKLWQDWLFSYSVPWLTQRRQILTATVRNLVPRREWYDTLDAHRAGYDANACPDSSADYQARALAAMRFEYQQVLKTFRLGTGQNKAIREILTLCREHHIAAALLFMPESEPFRELYPPHVLRELDQWGAEMKQEFGIPIIDARTWVDREGFFDTHHLFDTGARQFSERLKIELQNQWARLSPALTRSALAFHARRDVKAVVGENATPARR